MPKETQLEWLSKDSNLDTSKAEDFNHILFAYTKNKIRIIGGRLHIQNNQQLKYQKLELNLRCDRSLKKNEKFKHYAIEDNHFLDPKDPST